MPSAPVFCFHVVYIGQAGTRENGEGVLYRLQEHRRNSDKDYWTKAVVFTTSNNTFGPTEISYLENRFCTLASYAGRYLVKNGNDPSSGNITEEKESELEEFIDNSIILMGTLGHKVFEKLAETSTYDLHGNIESADSLLFLKRKNWKSQVLIESTCKQTSEGCVVLKGSRIDIIDSERVPPGIIERRRSASISSDRILQEDVLFRSPSYAAFFVVGGHANGLTEWKSIDGKTLK